MPGGDDRTDRLGTGFDAGEVHQHRAHRRRVLGQAHAHLGGDAAHSLCADECAAQVVAQRFRFFTAQLHDLTVWQHDFEAEHVRRGDAVGETVRAAGVVGDIAADRATLLTAGVGGEVQAVSSDGPREIKVEHPGLDPRQPVDRIDRQNPVHLRDHDHDRVVERRRPARQTGAGTAGDERPAMTNCDAYAGLHLGCAGREAHDTGVTFDVRCVALVQRELGIADADSVGRERRAEVGYQCVGHARRRPLSPFRSRTCLSTMT